MLIKKRKQWRASGGKRLGFFCAAKSITACLSLFVAGKDTSYAMPGAPFCSDG